MEQTQPAMHSESVRPLERVKVVDLSRLVSGNMLTHVLADLGATVIKVEPPRKGDELRAWQRAGMSTYWIAYSRNKHSVELNLRTDEGMKELRALLHDADILVENFRPGTLERMGLGKEQLNALNPRLVVVRISGWGQTGEFANKGGFGSLIEAMSGFAAMNGFSDLPPVLPPFAMADSVAGIYGAALAMAAMHGQRDRTATEVQEIDLSLFEPLFSILGPQAAEFQLTGKPTPRSGSRSPTHAPRNVYRTKDEKWVALSAGMEGTLARLFDGIGYPQGLQDPRFSTHEARLKNIDALDALIQGHIVKLTLPEALDFFAVRDITAGPVCDIEDLLKHPYILERNLLVEQAAPDGRKVLVHAAPYRINGNRPPILRGAPSIGQDNAQWLSKSSNTTVASVSTPVYAATNQA
ncbi:CoA transferase [Comamonas testosteroni]|uniref:CoA transferase n=1 Tax=Comamonas testosteroni TaxID=285 RepID=A0A5A7MKY4_COMTE|nr:CaiB/BaiF CoA-transferase family protein [Comamonas testosteroni]GEQ78140.1 CoA transferase [Comamonas testosteroni]